MAILNNQDFEANFNSIFQLKLKGIKDKDKIAQARKNRRNEQMRSHN